MTAEKLIIGTAWIGDARLPEVDISSVDVF